MTTPDHLPEVSEEQPQNATEIYREVSGTYATFNLDSRPETEAQLRKYNSSWINQLPEGDKAEATRQWAYCMLNELALRRADEHRNDYGFARFFALQAPKNQGEYGMNKAVLDDVVSKFRYASEHGNADTKKKADDILQTIQTKILAHLRIPEPEVARATLKLQDYLPIKVQHSGWNVDSLKISLSEAEEGRLARAKSQGYSLVTKGDFDGRAGGKLILYKNGSPVVPEKTAYVPGFTLTIVGSPLE